MDERPNRPLTLPFTFQGVAQFARASFSRLVTFQLGVALIAAGGAAAFFELAWAPVVQRVLAKLPDTGTIQDGTLRWPRPEPVRALGSSFLWISVDPTDSLEPSEGADLQLEFGRTELRLRSLLGYWSVPYPKGYEIAFNRPDLEPKWGAWHLPLLVAASTGVTLGLLIIWSALALAYLWPVRLIAFYADRTLSWPGAWRLAAATLLPGALFFELAIFGYLFHHINLVQLLFAGVLHLMIGWVFVLACPFCLPREPELEGTGRKSNPFAGSKP
jgi:hypothetical protein